MFAREPLSVVPGLAEIDTVLEEMKDRAVIQGYAANDLAFELMRLGDDALAVEFLDKPGDGFQGDVAFEDRPDRFGLRFD